MYHEITKEKRRRRLRKRIVGILIVVAIVVGVWSVYGYMQADLRAQSELSIRNAILNTAKQCFAIEGSYPSSLKYLEENYGLVINRNDFVITYNIFAENIMPDVVVKSR